MQDLLQESQPATEGFTFKQFLAFVESRPDHERWELIEGVIELNATATDFHQIIVTNLVSYLDAAAQREGDSWMVLPGLGIHLPSDDSNAPNPDVLVRPTPLSSVHFCNDALIIVEVLSRSTRRKDLTTKREYYTKLPSLEHYIIIEPQQLLVRDYARQTGWTERKRTQAGDLLELAGLGVNVPIRQVYRSTGLA